MRFLRSIYFCAFSAADDILLDSDNTCKRSYMRSIESKPFALLGRVKRNQKSSIGKLKGIQFFTECQSF